MAFKFLLWYNRLVFGELAQLGERLAGSQEVRGSSPLFSTKYQKSEVLASDFLSLIGASKSVLEFENIRVIKEMRNNVNRLVNMETANLNKIVNSSLDQVNDILYIDKEIGLNSLDENLREVALLRLKNRESSLRDIGNLLNPKIGKSAVNYRMKKLREIAKLLRSGDYGNKRNKTF